MPIGEAFLSSSVQFLFDRLVSAAITELGKIYGVKDELEKLQATLNRLRAMLHDAEERKMEGETFRVWLQELKNAACDAEDVVDEFEYEDLRRRLQNSREGGGGVGKSLLSSTSVKVCALCSCLSPREVAFRHKMARRIDKIREKLDEISKDMTNINIGGTLGVGVNQPEFKRDVKETTSFLGDPDVFGRDEVKNQLIRLLLGTTDARPSASPSTSEVHPTSVSVISILGMGGLGKTTLAQWVYNSKEVQEFFQPSMWVWVSQDFDQKKVTKQILEHVVDPQSGLQSADNLNVLQRNLAESLKGKRFLLVLDDVWENDRTKWSEFLAPLTQGEKGSKILITTRNSDVANTVQSLKIELKMLSFDDCWSIFRKYAFPDDVNNDKHPKLESIGKEIVRKLHGVPLAASTIGGLLRFESDETKWRNVLNCELWEFDQGEQGIFNVLKLSYEYLPSHMKQCFTYCCVFPKGWRFDVLSLVQVWMAQGYVRPQGRKLMEDVGRGFFDELLNRSLLQFVNGEYVIHDLLHDLGRRILQHDFHDIQVNSSSDDAHFKRHMVLYHKESNWSELEIFCKFQNLRTLLFQFCEDNNRFQIPQMLFDAVKCLRVLDLSNCLIETLPDSVGYLKHLRYLGLAETEIECLPESLCSLYKLQTLELRGCDKLRMLPKGMSNLISLHYLEAESDLVSKIVKIGKLTHLQRLEVFSVSKENENRISDLKNMNELRGKLCILNLQKVESREEAIKTTLKTKQHLDILELQWADGRHVEKTDIHLEESILEGLQPPPQLNELIIKCYAGIKLPNWIKQSSISSLESIHLHRCINLNLLPPLGELHFLKTLDITGCLQIKELPHLPMTLRNFILRDARLVNALPNSLQHLPLEQLTICEIPDLKELPLLPVSLKELRVEGVGLDILPEIYQGDGPSAAITVGCSEYGGGENTGPLLSILKIRACPHLTTLHESLLQHHLSHLRVLSMEECEELVNWPEGEGFGATLLSLREELSIVGCPKLKALPEGSELPPSLQKFCVKDCPGVPNALLFSQLHNLKCESVHVGHSYHNLTHCSNEALQHIVALDWLTICYQQGDAGCGNESPPPPQSPCSITYKSEEQWSWALDKHSLYRHVKLVIEGRRGKRSLEDDDNSGLVYKCLRGQPWAPSLHQLTLDSLPERAFLGVKHIRRRREHGPEEQEDDEGEHDEVMLHHPLVLPLLECLEILHCREMRKLPTEILLCHLKDLEISDCPELTLSSIEEGIRSLPSLQALEITNCPNLLLRMTSPPLHDGDSDHHALSPVPPAPLPLVPLLLLRYLVVDNTKLLVNTECFFRNHLLTSLRFVMITGPELTCLMAEEEEGLRNLSSSLHCLAFHNCPNLQNLPADLRGLLPNLKVLGISQCPKIRFLLDVGLPISLEFLVINGCPALEERCRRRPGAEDDNDWHKIAGIPVVIFDDEWQRGSYSKFQELKAKWDFVFPVDLE